jgi:hypothetical protein
MSGRQIDCAAVAYESPRELWHWLILERKAQEGRMEPSERLNVDLTPGQRTLLEWIVQQVYDGTLPEEFEVLWSHQGPEIPRFTGGAIPEQLIRCITKSALDALRSEGLINCESIPWHTREIRLGAGERGRRCSLTTVAFTTVDSMRASSTVPSEDQSHHQTSLEEDKPLKAASVDFQYDIAAIRTLLRNSFTAKDLWRFCQTRPALEPILAHFSPGHSLEDMIDVVTEYCRTRMLFPELLSEIRSYDPKQFEIYRSKSFEVDASLESTRQTHSILDSAPNRQSSKAEFTPEQVFEARKGFSVQVISYDVSQEYGASFPYSDYVRLRVTNNSTTTLPHLTVLTKCYDSSGKLIGSSRAPSIPTGNLSPGESAEYDYYPKGHLPGASKLTVEIEQLIDEGSMQFFEEFGDRESIQSGAPQANEDVQRLPNPLAHEQLAQGPSHEYDFSQLRLSTSDQTQKALPSEREFHITIGTSPSGKLDLKQELRLVKAALLYADHTKLYSLTASMMQMISRLGDSSLKQQLDLFEMVVPYLAPEDSAAELLAGLERYKRLVRQRTIRNRRDQLFKTGFQRILAKYSDDIKDKATELARDAGIDSINLAVESGLLELHTFKGTDDERTILRFTADSVGRASGSPVWALRASESSALDDEIIWEFVERVSSAVSNGLTYPLFDGKTSDLVQALVREKHIDISDSDVDRGKHSGLAGHLLQRLPLFDQASIDEILDIRQELDRPLVRFRGAIVKFSQDIESAHWDKDFASDAEQVFYRDVAPAILDIEEAVKSNRLLTVILRRFVDKPMTLVQGSLLSIVLSQVSQLPEEIVLGLGVAASSAAVVYDAYREWEEKRKEVEKNQLYFYHQAQKRLSASH